MAGGVANLPPLTRPRAFCNAGMTHRTKPLYRVGVAPAAAVDDIEAPVEAGLDVAALVPRMGTPEALCAAPVLPVAETGEELALAAAAALEESFLAALWQKYLHALETNPVLVKSCTSLFGFLIGDICAQLIVGAHYDAYRTLRMTLFGILMDGPIGHCWYLFLDKKVMPESPKSPRAIVFKTGLDQLVWAPFFSCVFFTFNQTLQGHPELSLATIQATLIPTLTANYALWPLAHLINFKFIPSNQRILYINFVQILWTSYLSNLATRHGGVMTGMHKSIAHPVTFRWIHHIQHHIWHHAHLSCPVLHSHGHHHLFV